MIYPALHLKRGQLFTLKGSVTACIYESTSKIMNLVLLTFKLFICELIISYTFNLNNIISLKYNTVVLVILAVYYNTCRHVCMLNIV